MSGGILVLGATGMLGHKVFQRLSGSFPEVHAVMQRRIDDPAVRNIGLFRNPNATGGIDALGWAPLEQLLREKRPRVVINCIGIVKQRAEAKAAIPSITINALLPHRLAEVLAKWDGRLIHFSTDCVFSGRRGAYTEADHCDAEDLYGLSKFLGEVAAPNAVTLRTSMIGRELFHLESLLEWFLGQQGKTVRGYTRAMYSGLTNIELARVVERLIVDWPTVHGLYQVCAPAISKHELLCMLRDRLRLNVEIVPDDEFHCDRSMRGDKFRAATGYVPPAWTELIEAIATDPTPYESWRTLHEAV